MAKKAFLVTALAVAAHDGRADSSVTQPRSTGPSLEATLQFVQQKISDLGTVNYIAFIQDAQANTTFQNTFADEFTNVQADVSSCKLRYHYKVTRDGAVLMEHDLVLPFALLEDVVVEPEVQRLSLASAQSGHPNLIATSTNPLVTTLLARGMASGRRFSQGFPFTDPDLADRVAKAITHAIELCGGGNKEPF